MSVPGYACCWPVQTTSLGRPMNSACEALFPALHAAFTPPTGLPARMHAVLIDEAGQASEVATLQPLVLGAKRCASVGFPARLRFTCCSGCSSKSSFPPRCSLAHAALLFPAHP